MRLIFNVRLEGRLAPHGYTNPIRTAFEVPDGLLSGSPAPADKLENLVTVRKHCAEHIQQLFLSPSDHSAFDGCRVLLNAVNQISPEEKPVDPEELTIRWVAKDELTNPVDVLSVLSIARCNSLDQLQEMINKDSIHISIWRTNDLESSMRYDGPQSLPPCPNKGVTIRSKLLASDRTVLRCASPIHVVLYDDRDVRRLCSELLGILSRQYALPPDARVKLWCRRTAMSSHSQLYHETISIKRFPLELSLSRVAQVPLHVAVVLKSEQQPSPSFTIAASVGTPLQPGPPCLSSPRSNAPVADGSAPIKVCVQDARQSSVRADVLPPGGVLPTLPLDPITNTSPPQTRYSTSAQLALLEENRQMRADLRESRCLLSKVWERQDEATRGMRELGTHIQNVVKDMQALHSIQAAEREEREKSIERLLVDLVAQRQAMEVVRSVSHVRQHSMPECQTGVSGKVSGEVLLHGVHQALATALPSQPQSLTWEPAYLPDAQLPQAHLPTAEWPNPAVAGSLESKPSHSPEQLHHELSNQEVHQILQCLERCHDLLLDPRLNSGPPGQYLRTKAGPVMRTGTSLPQRKLGASGSVATNAAATLSSPDASDHEPKQDLPRQSLPPTETNDERGSKAKAWGLNASALPRQSQHHQNMQAEPMMHSCAQPDRPSEIKPDRTTDTTPPSILEPASTTELQDLIPKTVQTSSLLESGVLVDSNTESSTASSAPCVSASVESLLGSEQVPRLSPPMAAERVPSHDGESGSSVITIPSHALSHEENQDSDWSVGGLGRMGSVHSHPSTVTLDMSGLSSTVQLDPVLVSDDAQSMTGSQPYPDSEAFFQSDEEAGDEYELVTRPPSMTSSYD